MPLLDATGKVLDIAAPKSELIEIEAGDRFHLPSVFDVFACNDADGSFAQIVPQLGTRVSAIEALNMLKQNPDFLGRKLFIVEVKRIPILANFPPRAMRMMQLTTSKPEAFIKEGAGTVPEEGQEIPKPEHWKGPANED